MVGKATPRNVWDLPLRKGQIVPYWDSHVSVSAPTPYSQQIVVAWHNKRRTPVWKTTQLLKQKRDPSQPEKNGIVMETCIPKNIVQLQLTKLVGWTHLKNISQIPSFPQISGKKTSPQTNLWNHHPGDQNSSHPVGAFGLQLTIEVQDFSTSSFHLKTLGLSWCIKGPTKMDQKNVTYPSEGIVHKYMEEIYIYILWSPKIYLSIYIYTYLYRLIHMFIYLYVYICISVVCMYTTSIHDIHQPSTSKWGSRQPFYNYTNPFTHQNALAWVSLLWFPRWGVLNCRRVKSLQAPMVENGGPLQNWRFRTWTFHHS